jgi:hypothetical protein
VLPKLKTPFYHPQAGTVIEFGVAEGVEWRSA